MRWPGISRDIERMVRECPMCEKYRKERIEPMRGTEFPDHPWSRVGADFFQHEGKVYLLVVNYDSRDVEISTVSKHLNTIDTILKMKRVFSRHGIPDIVFSDNGPQFDSNELHDLAADWGFQHITSSPKYLQSNGEVERAVQTMKMILKKSMDEYVALLSYRNTQLHNGYSPAQLSMSRKLKTRVPCHPNELKPQLPDYELVKKKEKVYRDKMKADYDRRHRIVQPNGPFPGDRVWIPDLKREGMVLRYDESPRSVVIKTSKGNVRRNRCMTRNIPNNPALPHKPVSIPQIPLSRATPEMAQPVVDQPEEEPHPAIDAASDQPVLRRSQTDRRPPRRYADEY